MVNILLGKTCFKRDYSDAYIVIKGTINLRTNGKNMFRKMLYLKVMHHFSRA